MSESLEKFKARSNRISRLGQVASIAGWDQQTYMPTGSAQARGEQLAVISEFIHELSVSDETGDLLSAAEAETAGLDADSDEVRMVKVARRNFDLAHKLPGSLVAEISRQQAVAMSAWQEARATANFSLFAPSLKIMMELTRQSAEYIGYKDHIYDALIDQSEIGATHQSIAAMFAELTPELVKLTAQIREAEQVDDSLIHGDFPIEKQKQTTLSIVQKLGYDLTRGRQDEAAHPFCTSFSREDVRITTRYDARFLQQALYASLHEAGHAMYEQGLPAAYSGTPIGQAASLGIHESQSRLWENQVGRGRAFSKFVLPILQEAYPTQLGSATPEAYYKAVNRVEPSFIRVEADEVTYNLHVALRFELESLVLTDKLAVDDLPDAWNARMKEYLGVTPINDAVGVLQDVHWAIGLIGYFPTYSIGNLVSAQLWKTISTVIPDVDEKIERGEFSEILSWLNTNVHAYGCKYLPGEIVVRATGAPLSAAPYLQYLNRKYADIYRL